ncbi:hypothetical protein HYPSUDRAFT_44461 [Hypholoma sublateritium FD-334 SS-4]|uniref:Uncharacterized protein n=1 Tax=Hypholoma sublateritium (strain FD-334 SS-4) TaxID=945553 RepID=A0A0D2NR79_HYPSF|nr:hypothetical protein HYPSUDRAFT_44461 [Hypholoma sublateritium FD-334 SS-4]
MGRKVKVTAAILKRAWGAQAAAHESLPAPQPAPVPAACAPMIHSLASDSTHTSEALQHPVTAQHGAVASTNKARKRSRSKSLECSPERPSKRRTLPGNVAVDCSSSEHSVATPVPSKPASSRPAGYDMVACTPHPEFYQKTETCVIMVEHMLLCAENTVILAPAR